MKYSAQSNRGEFNCYKIVEQLFPKLTREKPTQDTLGF